jgi:hypothetical protein
MQKHYKLLSGMMMGLFIHTTVNGQYVAHFDSLFSSSNQYMDGTGAEVRGSFQSANVQFSNVYQTQYGGFWSDGWAISNVKNDTTAGFTNLYASYANAARSGTNYMVGQGGSVLVPTGADAGKTLKGLYVTNGTYPALSMLNGDNFAKKFGGVSGNDPDYFALSIFAYRNGVKSSDSVAFYLADFRNSDNAQDYIVKQWTYVDLTALGAADSILFKLSSSDEGQFGMNTPGFFCVDDVVTDSDTADGEGWSLAANSYFNRTDAKLRSVVAQGPMQFPTTYTVTKAYGNYWSAGFAPSSMVDTTTTGFTNLFACYAGSGAMGSLGYAIAQQKATIKLGDAGARLNGVYITNATYTALSMLNGDAFAKKFGGMSGNDTDWFKVSFVGYQSGAADTVVAYLADYRSANNTQDYIVKDWKWVDLSTLGVCDSLQLVLSSSDVGQFGMNTPAYMAIDGLTVTEVTGLADTKLADLEVTLYPNPVSQVLTIETGTAPSTVEVLDMRGNLVLSAPASTQHQLNVSGLAAGLYLLRAHSAMGISTRKFVKQ